MAPISRTKQLSALLNLVKYGLMAKLNVSLYLLLCGDVSLNPGPIAMDSNDFKLPNNKGVLVTVTSIKRVYYTKRTATY